MGYVFVRWGILLTNIKCKTAKHAEKPYKMYDSEGLFLYVTKTSKVWRFRYRLNKKEKLLSFGKYPRVSLLMARKARDEALRNLEDFIDPSLIRKQKRAKAESEEDTFQKVFDAWWENRRQEWTQKHADKVKRAISKIVLPSLGKISLDGITPPMVLSILRKVEKKSPDKAHRLKGWVSGVFSYGVALGLCNSNPALQLTSVLKPVRSGRRPAIIDLKELKKLMYVLDSYPCSPITKLAMRFLALTALRSGEVRSLSWDDLHGDIIRIPAAKMKMKRDHVVPLSRQAMDVLEAVKPLSLNASFIFHAVYFKNRKMSDMTLAVLLKKAGYKGIHVPHGFRSSFSSIMNERRPQDRFIIDLMLAHVNRNNVEAAYNRAEHIELRREIAQEWADLICADLVPAKELIG